MHMTPRYLGYHTYYILLSIKEKRNWNPKWMEFRTRTLHSPPIPDLLFVAAIHLFRSAGGEFVCHNINIIVLMMDAPNVVSV